MDTINIVDPSTGIAHAIPFDQVGFALEAGGQFADEDQKQLAMQISAQKKGESYLPPISLAQKDDSEQMENPEITGLKGVLYDLLKGTKGAFYGGLQFAKDVPQMTEDLGEKLLEKPITEPVRGIGQIGAEAASIGKNIFNAPFNLNQYLARKHLLPESFGKLGKLIPHIPEDTGIEKLMGLQPKKEDRLLRGLTEGAAILAPAPSIGKALKAKLTAPSKETLFQRSLEKKIEEAASEFQLSKESVEALKDSLRREFSKQYKKKIGELSPVGQEEAINIKEGKIEELKPYLEIDEQKVPEIPPKPDIKSIIEEKKSLVESAKNEAQEALGTLHNPRLKGAKKVKDSIEKVKKNSSDLYDAARAYYIDKKITADNTAEIAEITKDLEALKNADELAPGYGSGTAEQKVLEEKISALSNEKVNASDIFDLQRTLEKMAENTRKKQFSGVTDIEFKKLNNLAERLDEHAEKLAKRLESVGGKDVQKMISEANKGWKIYKDLTNYNPVGKGALKGEIPIRSLIEIAKNHPGNDFLRALVESDPELKKNMLAAYAGEKNVNKLLQPTTLVKKYIQDLPEVEEHVNALKEALKGVKEGNVKASKIKKEYDDLVKSIKETAEKQKERQNAIRESEKLKKEIEFHKQAIPKLEEKINEMKRKGEDHKKATKELEDHKKNIKDKNHLLKKYGDIILKITGLSTIGHKLGL